MRLPYILLLLLVTITGKAQNILSNGNFEQYTTCPTAIAQADRCVGWFAYDNSPDYFNVCGTGVGNVPNARFGYQQPASGNAYMGFYCFDGSSSTKYREFLVTAIPPLQIGTAYEVSVSVSLPNQTPVASNEIGVLFYDKGPTTFPIIGNPTGIPQIMFTSQGPITDTQNWVRVTQTFIADSAYDYLVIGAFKDWPAITTADTVHVRTGTYSYYYIDSIVVRPADGLYLSVTDSLLCTGDSIIVPFTANNFSPTSTFTLQLSDATGSFGLPINIATVIGSSSGVLKGTVPLGLGVGTGYRLRIVASSPATTVVSPVTIDIGNSMPVKPVAMGNSPVCSGGTLFLNASTPSTGVTWQWTGPAFSSNIQAPVISNFGINNMGNYIVTARNIGCEAKDTINIAYQVFTSPTITNSGPICEGSDLTLTVNTSTPGITYSWTGPNGFSSSLQNPSITASTASMSGQYTVTITQGVCSVTKTTTVVINSPIPIKPVAIGNSPVCGGDTLFLDASTPTPGVTWQWTGPAFSSNLQAPKILNFSPANAGDYIITARNGACLSKDTVKISYQAPISLTASNSGPICEGTAFTLTATPFTSGATYSWTGPGFTSTFQNPSRSGTTASMGGDYIVTATLNACSINDTTTVIINPVPIATAVISNAVCAGGALYLSAASTLSGSSFSWTGPGFSSSQQSPSISPASVSHNGTYNVVAKKDGCSSLPASVQATVYLTPATPSASNTGPVCIGLPVSFNAVSATPGVSYSWTGPGFSSNIQNPNIPGTGNANAGIYSVTATLGSCTSAPATTTLVVVERPVVGAYVSPNDTVCANASPFFQAFPKNQGATPQYQWYRNNQPILGATQTMYTASGLQDGDIIKFMVKANTACTDPVNSNDIRMTIIPVITNPKVTITTEPAMPVAPWQTVVFNARIDHIGTKTKYQWRLNGADIFGATAASWSTYNLREGDKVTVMVYTDNPCADIDSALSAPLIIHHRTGIAGTDTRSGAVLYPNPNDGNFTIEGITTNDAVKLDIINTLGQSVYSSELKADNGSINLFVPGLAAGTYLLRLRFADKQQTIKLNIE